MEKILQEFKYLRLYLHACRNKLAIAIRVEVLNIYNIGVFVSLPKAGVTIPIGIASTILEAMPSGIVTSLRFSRRPPEAGIVTLLRFSRRRLRFRDRHVATLLTKTLSPLLRLSDSPVPFSLCARLGKSIHASLFYQPIILLTQMSLCSSIAVMSDLFYLKLISSSIAFCKRLLKVAESSIIIKCPNPFMKVTSKDRA